VTSGAAPLAVTDDDQLVEPVLAGDHRCEGITGGKEAGVARLEQSVSLRPFGSPSYWALQPSRSRTMIGICRVAFARSWYLSRSGIT
jgi:hypothetical protein